MSHRPYISLWLLLAAAFGVFFMLSMAEGELRLPGDAGTLRTASFADVLRPTPLMAGEMTPEEMFADSTDIIPDSIIAAPDTASHTILFIGDSMLDGLSPRMEKYCLANGHRLVSVRWYSSSTERWGSSPRLAALIEKYKPSYVFVCLGANELNISRVEEKRGPRVRKILSDIGALPYVWIGPPNWKKDTGINALIEKSARPGCFFLSDGMEFERRADGAHPTNRSAALWLDSVMRWMPLHAAHPIRMRLPEDTVVPAKAPGQITVRLIQPDEE